MTTATTDPTDYARFLDAARRIIGNLHSHDWDSPEAVAARATEQGSCVWHAAHTIRLEHLDELGYGSCRYCGGVTAPGHDGAHNLCSVRHASGRPTPTLDSTPECSCAKCRPDVRRMI